MQKTAATLLFAFLVFLSVPFVALAGPKKVVASILPIYVFTENVANGIAEASLLVPPGTGVHEFTLRPRDLKALGEADLVLFSGQGLDDHLIDKLQALGPAKVVNTSKKIPKADIHASKDPHIWLDPLLAAKQVQYIAKALSEVDPGNKENYARAASSYTGKLVILHVLMFKTLRKYQGSYLITYHEAFTHLAARYGLATLSITGPSADQAGPARLKKIYDIVRTKKVKGVFVEKHFPSESMRRLAKDLGVKVCTLDTFETGALDLGAYERAMKENLKSIVECLK